MEGIVPLLALAALLLLAVFRGISKNSSRHGSRYQYSDDSIFQENIPVITKIQPIDVYGDAVFLNRDCTDLEDFIINNEINEYDIFKLCELNNIHLQIPKAWIPLVIEMIIELDRQGWDRQVSCIKEKYASLRFYSQSADYHILEKYEKKSETVCQECGECGKIRYVGWEFVACRKHYLENRGKIETEPEGFKYRESLYKWAEVQALNIVLDHNQLIGSVKVVLINKTLLNLSGSPDNITYVYGSAIGFGYFLNHIPDNLWVLGSKDAEGYRHVTFCEICGYEAVYNGKCECCENDTWRTYRNRWKYDEDGKYEYIKYRQIFWVQDEGEKYEQLQKNYTKNPDYGILYTEEELNSAND